MNAAENKAVFLSYASQDAEAVERIAEALRAAGVEVWFDKDELVGGDAWDKKIRAQIKECALFVPVISAATQARTEGYFRLEWRLADQRTHLMAKGRPFLLPVVIDVTRDAEAHVPDSFSEVQWTRLPGGETPEKFCTRVKTLLGGNEVARAFQPVASEPTGWKARATPASRPWLVPAIVSLTAAVAAVAIWQPWKKAQSAVPAKSVEAPLPAAPLSEARKLAAQARALLLKPGGATTKFDTAALLCDRALALDPTDADTWAIASQVDARLWFHSLDKTEKRGESARSKAAKARTLAPDSFEARLAQSSYLVLVAGRPMADQAEPVLRALRAENPEEFRVPDTLSKLLQLRGRDDEALACIKEAAPLPGVGASVWSQAGWILHRLRRIAEMEAALDQSIAIQPISGAVTLRVFYDLGWHGDPDHALATLRKLPAEELAEDIGVAAAVRVYRWRREPAELLKFLATVPRDWITWTIRGPKAALTGDAHAELGRPSAARADWQSALALVEQRLATTPNDRQLHEWRTYLLAALGETDPARAAYARSLETPPAELSLLDIEKIHRCLSPDAVIDELERRAQVTTAALDKGEQVMDRFISAADLRLNPAWDGVRHQPRFQTLQARLAADPRFSPTPKPATVTTTPAASASEKSVAVLAFRNLSDAQSGDYFSDGLSEELCNVLGRVPGLRVAGSTSAFSFKGKAATLPDIARQLGVAYLVEGSVQREGADVRITAKLINGADGLQVWTSGNLKRKVESSLALQEEIAGLIAKELSLKLGVATAAPANANVNPQAFELYLQGRQAWNLRSPEGYARAESLLQQAIVIAPDFARAHAALSDVWLIRGADLEPGGGTFAWRESATVRRAQAQAEKAVALDPTSAEALASLANVSYFAWKMEESVAGHRRCLVLNPNYASAHQWLGDSLFKLGWIDEGLVEMAKATELDPLSFIAWSALGGGLLSAGKLEAALAAYDRAQQLSPSAVQSGRARTLVRLGRVAEAVPLTEKSGDRWHDEDMWRAFVLDKAGRRSDAEKMIAEAGPERKFWGWLTLGRTDAALAVLSPAIFNAGSMSLYLVLSDPMIDPIRGDPRFGKTLATLGLTEAHARAQAWRAAHPPEKAK